MALSAALLGATASQASEPQAPLGGRGVGDSHQNGAQPTDAMPATPVTTELLCEQSFRHELPPLSSASWRIDGNPGDVLSLRYAEAPPLHSELTQADGSRFPAAGVADLSDTQTYFLPRRARYSFTVIAGGAGASYEIALTCADNRPAPSPTITPTPPPAPQPSPSGALRSRTDAVQPVGDLAVSLVWLSTADLDLHVIDSRGEEISFENPRSLTGGLLEHEANGNCTLATSEPSEIVFWKEGTAPTGDYQVIVSYYGTCQGEGEQDFAVGVWIDGALVQLFEGRIAVGQRQSVVDFSY